MAQLIDKRKDQEQEVQLNGSREARLRTRSRSTRARETVGTKRRHGREIAGSKSEEDRGSEEAGSGKQDAEIS